MPDGLGGVWALQGPAVIRLAIGGEQEVVVSPFPPEALPVRLVPEPATRSVWALGGTALIRLTPAGQVQESVSLGPAPAQDFAPGPLAADEEGPLLILEDPADGSVVDAESFPVSLSWSDAGAGANGGSFVLWMNGEDSGADCSTSFLGATCTVTELPAGSHTLSAQVADYLGNESLPASVTVVVETAEDPGGGGTANEPTNPPELDDPEPYRFTAPERGVNANRVYLSDEQIESISTSSGNLTLTIPLGQTYTVGPQLAYQFQLVHNSQVWQRVGLRCTGSSGAVPCPSGTGAGTTVAMTVPNPTSNAGLGWSLHLGRLFNSTAPTGLVGLEQELWPNRSRDGDPTAVWIYEAPDGSQHTFHELPGRPSSQGTTLYTKDGTHLRLRRSGSEIVLDHPNGVQTIFRKYSGEAGTLFCGGGVANCWRFIERKDRYGNRVWASYGYDGNNKIETWTVRDSTGRRHTLKFSRADAQRAGGDATGPIERGNGDEWGDLRSVLTSVDTAAFGGQRAVYRPIYSAQRVSRGCPQSGELLVNGEPMTIRTQVLDQILNPLIRPWKFQTLGVLAPTAPDGCQLYSGQISEVTLPSRGKLAYTYQNWEFPTRCDFRPRENPNIDVPLRYRQPGIATKRRLAAAGGLAEGPWTYSSGLSEGGSLISAGPQCDREKLLTTTVDGPPVDGSYTRQVFYTAMAEGPAQPEATNPLSAWQVTDHRLPFTKKASLSVTDTEGAPVFLSRQVYECPSPGACGSVHKKRSTYVRYASEWDKRCNKNLGASPGCFRSDATQIVERTVYHDDANRYRELRFEAQTGFGFARRSETKDNFASLATATQTTAYSKGSPGLGINAVTGLFTMGSPSTYYPAISAPWILHPYTEKRWIEGGQTYVREAQFNNHGTLTCERRRLSSSGKRAQDVVVRYDLGAVVGVNAGLPVLETWAGGDGGSLSTGVVCSAANNPASASDFYTITHTYADLVLSKSRVGGPSFPNTYRADIDPNTGLPSKTYTVSEQPTTLSYDKLGRLTRATPAASLSAGTTWLFHASPTNARPSVRVERRDGSSVESVTETTFDDFGRLYEKRIRRPDSAWSKQQWLYDRAGRLEKETTLQNESGHTNLKSQRYRDYDAFGRARTILAADDQATTFVYFGARKVDRTSGIATWLGANNVAVMEDSVQRSLYDGQGRLAESSIGEIVQVGGQSSFQAVHRTTYSYDPFGELTLARRFADAASQTRLWGRDGRGFLTSETHPELGSASSVSGTISYKSGALGQQTERNNALHRLFSEYDEAGRKTRLRESALTWAEWTYGTSASGPDYNRGKLIQAIRHNHIGTPGNTSDWKVTETYTYREALGQVDSRETKLDIIAPGGGVTAGPRFSQTWDWDALGRLSSLGYPQCTSASCTGPDDSQGPTRAVTWSYTHGLPTRIASSEGGAPSQTADYLYHSNLQLSRASYSNSASTQFYLGTNNMARPQRIRFYRGAAAQFDTGTYQYDPSGNLWAIGNDRYTYDLAGRLVSGTVYHGGPTRQEANTYDGFDNVVQSVIDGNTAAPALYYADQKNRMLGGRAGFVDTDYDVAGQLRFWDLDQDRPGDELEMQYDALGMQTSFKRYHKVSQNPPQWFQRNYVDIYGPGNLRLCSWYNEDGSMVYSLRDLNGKVIRTYNVVGAPPGTQWTFDKDYLFGPEGMFGTYGNGGALRFFHNDHLGTPRQITERFGIVVGRHNYYPFGSETPPAAGTYDDRVCKYTSHERDRNGGTDYMLGRTYLYPLKRFSTVDPGRDGWNLYAYGAGNPVKYTDPTGYEAVGIDLSADEETLRQREIVDDALVQMVVESYEDYGPLGVLISYPFSLLGRIITSIGAPSSNEEIILNAMAIGSVARAPSTAVRSGSAAPRAVGNSGRFVDGELFETAVSSSSGNVGVLAETSISGKTLTLSDIVVYADNGALVNQVGAGQFLALRSQIAGQAAAAGFETLEIQGLRLATSSSANPGSVINRVFDLSRY